MEIVEGKFNNMKTFIRSLPIPPSDYLNKYYAMNYTDFLSLVKLAINSGKNRAELLNELYRGFNVDITQYRSDDITKFERYIEYFFAIVKTI